MKYLDDTGLSYLWNKIKAKFATKTELQSAVISSSSGPSIQYVTDLDDVSSALSDNSVVFYDDEGGSS